MKLRRSTWVALPIVLLALIVLIVVAFATAFFYVRSPAGSKRLLGWAQEILERDYKTKFEYESATFDPFAGFHFKDLKITRSEGDIEANIEADALDVGYSLHIWTRLFELHEFRFIRPRIKVHAVLPAEPPTGPQAPSDSASPFKTLEDLLLNPPLQIRVQNFSIEDLNLDLDAQMGTLKNQALIKGFNMGLEMAMERKRLSLQGHFKFATAQIALASAAESPLVAQLQATLDAAWTIAIQNQNGAWHYELTSPGIRAALKDVKVQFGTGNDIMKLNLPTAALNAGAGVQATTAELFKVERESIRSADTTIDAELSQFEFAQGQSRRVTIASQKFAFKTRLADDIQTDLSFAAERIASPTDFAKPVRLDWTTNARISRDLQTADVKTVSALEGFTLLEAEAKAQFAETVSMTGKAKLTARAELAKTVKSLASLKQTGSVQADLGFTGSWDKANTLQLKFTGAVPQVRVATFKHPLQLETAGDLQWENARKHLKLDAQAQIGGDDIGRWLAKADLQAQLPDTPEAPPTASQKSQSSNLNRGSPSPLQLQSEGRTEISQLAEAKGLPLRFSQPLTVAHLVSLQPGHDSVHIETDIPAFALRDLARLNGTKVKVDVRSPQLTAANDVSITVDFDQSDVALDVPAAKSLPKFSGLTGRLVANVRDASTFSLDQFEYSFTQPAIRGSVQATGDIKRKTVSARSDVMMRFPEKFAPIPGHELRGEVRVPTTISVLNGNEVSINGEIAMRNVAWSKGPLGASGISGLVPFSEKLKWDGENIRFTHLISQNPFERVDFERVLPLLPDAQPLRIEKLAWEEKSYGPFIGFFSMRQNMLFAHQFDVDVKSGRVYGQMFFDIHPSNMQIGMLSRLTGLNLIEVLPKRYLTRVPKGDAKLSARTGFVLNLNRGTMDGRSDVTEIGGAQLIALINVLDPLYEDERMNTLRSLLQVGYPTGVELAFADGYLNLDVTLAALGLTHRQSLRAIPISSLLSNITSEIVKHTEKGPLK